MKNAGVMIVVGLMLAGCGTATKVATLTPDIEQRMITDLKSGNAVLDCGMSCEGSWSGASDQMYQLYTANSWDRLAVAVMQIGRRRDLGYFYLGAAAAGLGANEAAVKYYRMAGALATDTQESFKCTGINIKMIMSNECYSFVLPRDIYKPMWASEAIIAAAQPKAPVAKSNSGGPKSPKKQTPATPAPVEAAREPAHVQSEGWVTPPPVSR